ncbi:hypothetical protein ACFSR7_16735 [Cohnella sp. GCM10020058]
MKQASGGGIFEFCGIEVVDQLLFGGIPTTTEARKDMLAQVEKTLGAL